MYVIYYLSFCCVPYAWLHIQHAQADEINWYRWNFMHIYHVAEKSCH